MPAKVSYKGEDVKYGAPANVGTFTWAESVVVDEQMVVPLDKDVDVDATAPVGCAVMTGVGAAINAAMVRPGDCVAVIGVGGVGLSVVAGAAIAGAYPIIAVDLADEKLEFAKKFGATHGVNARNGDAVEQVRDMMGGGMLAGVDHAFDAIGAEDHDGAEPDDGASPPARHSRGRPGHRRRRAARRAGDARRWACSSAARSTAARPAAAASPTATSR